MLHLKLQPADFLDCSKAVCKFNPVTVSIALGLWFRFFLENLKGVFSGKPKELYSQISTSVYYGL